MVDQTVGELLKFRVTLDLERIDRLYLPVYMYQPRLQTGGDAANFFNASIQVKAAAIFLECEPL